MDSNAPTRSISSAPAAGISAATSAELLPEISKLPRHVAIIMDGNGRWARSRGYDRSMGHRRGAAIVHDIVEHASDLGLEALTLYGFSTENWARSSEEIDALMELYVEYLQLERETMLGNNVRFRQVGQRDGLPDAVLEQIDLTTEMTAHCTGMTLALAINYGSRSEITNAVQSIAQKVKDGMIDITDISPETIDQHLYTAGLPDPDLLIRTAGEMRLSNYLLWQCSYAEIHIEQACWPDFTAEHFDEAIREFASRQRRFGQAE